VKVKPTYYSLTPNGVRGNSSDWRLWIGNKGGTRGMSILLSIAVPRGGRDRNISAHKDELGALRL